jgi:hypothetical protein
MLCPQSTEHVAQVPRLPPDLHAQLTQHDRATESKGKAAHLYGTQGNMGISIT